MGLETIDFSNVSKAIESEFTFYDKDTLKNIVEELDNLNITLAPYPNIFRLLGALEQAKKTLRELDQSRKNLDLEKKLSEFIENLKEQEKILELDNIKTSFPKLEISDLSKDGYLKESEKSLKKFDLTPYHYFLIQKKIDIASIILEESIPYSISTLQITMAHTFKKEVEEQYPDFYAKSNTDRPKNEIFRRKIKETAAIMERKLIAPLEQKKKKLEKKMGDREDEILNNKIQCLEGLICKIENNIFNWKIDSIETYYSEKDPQKENSKEDNVILKEVQSILHETTSDIIKKDIEENKSKYNESYHPFLDGVGRFVRGLLKTTLRTIGNLGVAALTLGSAHITNAWIENNPIKTNIKDDDENPTKKGASRYVFFNLFEWAEKSKTNTLKTIEKTANKLANLKRAVTV